MTITKRLVKGSPLTYEELDANFEQLSNILNGNKGTYHDVTGQRAGNSAWNVNTSAFNKLIVIAVNPVDEVATSVGISVIEDYNAYYFSDYKNMQSAQAYSMSMLVPAGASWAFYVATPSAKTISKIYEFY